MKPRCPVCGRPPAQTDCGYHRCAAGHLFDDEPDEGGSHTDNPVASAISLEERAKRSKAINRRKFTHNKGGR